MNAPEPDTPAPKPRRPGRRWKRYVLLVLLVLLAAAGAIWYTLPLLESRAKEAKLQVYNLTSNDRYVAFSNTIDPSRTRMYVFDLKDNLVHKFFSKTEAVYDAKFSSTLENVVYMTTYIQGSDIDKTFFTSWKCDLNTGFCDKILSDHAKLTAPLELANGQLLYVRSISSYRIDAFAPEEKHLIYRDHDFYTYDKKNGLSKISDLGVYTLGYVNLAGEKLIFLAQGPSKLDYEIGRPGYQPGDSSYQPDGSSTIHILDLVYINEKYSISGNLRQPFVKVGNRLDTRPSAISSPPYIAFLSAYNDKNSKGKGWKFKIVLYDYLEKRVLHELYPKEKKFSNPSISPSGIVYYVEVDFEGMNLHKFNITNGNESTVVSRSWKDIDDLSKSIELK